MTPPADEITSHAGRASGPAKRPQRAAQSPPPELDHRVANSLQLAVDFLLFQQARLSEPAARKALIEAAERLVAVGHLHRFLCAHDGEREIDLAAFLEGLAALIAQSTGLRCRTEVEPCRVTGAVAQQLGLAVNELAINAAKHAYPMGEPGELSIQADRDGDQLRLVVADHGPGLAHGFDPRVAEGLGLDILQRIVRQLQGRLQAETDGGARFTLTLPLPRAASPIRSFAPPA
ncbi:MAG: sensor histidine kinase [Phenylobacterium sp.]